MENISNSLQCYSGLIKKRVLEKIGGSHESLKLSSCCTVDFSQALKDMPPYLSMKEELFQNMPNQRQVCKIVIWCEYRFMMKSPPVKYLVRIPWSRELTKMEARIHTIESASKSPGAGGVSKGLSLLAGTV